MNIQKEISLFKSDLKRHANPKRAEGAKNYLKSPWKFYGGTDTSSKRKLVKTWIRNNQDLSVNEVVKLENIILY